MASEEPSTALSGLKVLGPEEAPRVIRPPGIPGLQLEINGLAGSGWPRVAVAVRLPQPAPSKSTQMAEAIHRHNDKPLIFTPLNTESVSRRQGVLEKFKQRLSL